MKRTFVVLALLLVAGVFLAFADDAATPAGITFSAWGRQIYAPLMDNNTTTTSGVGSGIGTSWGNAPRIGFSVAGNSEYSGFWFHMGVDNNAFSITDDEGGWVKPLPGLEIQIGRAYNDTLRGEADFGSYDWIRTQWEGDDTTFNRIGGVKGGGSAPIDAIVSYKTGGLFVFACQADSAATTGLAQALDTWSAANTDPNGVYNNLSYGAGYTIAGIGTIKAQRLGYSVNSSTTVGQYQAAFNLSAVPNLYAEAAIWLPDNNTANYTFKLPVYLSYKAGAANIHALFIYDDFTSGNAGMNAGAGLDYDLGGGLGVGGDIRYANQYYMNDNAGIAQNSTSFLIDLTKGFSNGSVGIGFQYCTTDFVNQIDGSLDATQGHWAVPIKVEYWF
jgi:hypothetical protein